MFTVGDVVILGVLLVMVGFSIRSLHKQKKQGGCSGNCAGCSGCCKSHCQSDTGHTGH